MLRGIDGLKSVDKERKRIEDKEARVAVNRTSLAQQYAQGAYLHLMPHMTSAPHKVATRKPPVGPRRDLCAPIALYLLSIPN